jgi:predicted MFS family arabinose efflux permease
MTSPAIAGHPLLSRRYRTWLVAVLLLISIFNFADRVILSVLAQPIKEELRLTDTDLGLLQGLGFAILYSVLGVPLGWLAERMNRKGLIAACLVVWSAMTAAGGFATNFLTLLLGRVGVGLGEAGFMPLSSSLLSDHFKGDRRASILAVVMLGGPLGLLLGQSVGGWIASEWGWRTAFFAIGAPGMVCALLVWLTLHEPPRGLAEGHIATEPPPSLTAVVGHLWSMPTFRHLLAGLMLASFGMNGVAHFVMPLYLRGFGLPLATAGALFGAVSFFSNFPGMLAGGFGFDAMSRRDPRWALWGPAAVTALSAPLYVVAFASDNVAVSLSFLWCANFVLVAHFTPTSAAMQNLVGPRMRASTTALVAVVTGLIGAGLGPTVVGMASDLFASRAFGAADFIASCPGGRAGPGAAAGLDAACRAASTQGLRYALIVIQVSFVWAGVHYFRAARTLRGDVYRPPALQAAVA